MTLLYLILAHLLADYIFQPTKLVSWKIKSWKGVFFHSTIHFFITGLLLYLYLGNLAVWLLAFLLASTHFFIDLIKTTHQKSTKHGMLAYWLDQTFHLISILAIFAISQQSIFQTNLKFSSNTLYSTYTSPALIIYLCLAIFVTYTIEYGYFPSRHKQTNQKTPLQVKKMITRLFLMTLIYIGLIFAIPAASALLFIK